MHDLFYLIAHTMLIIFAVPLKMGHFSICVVIWELSQIKGNVKG